MSEIMRLGYSFALAHLDAAIHTVEGPHAWDLGPVYALIRAALEAAGPGVWVAYPGEREERLRRSFSWWSKNADDQAQRGVFGEFGLQWPSRADLDELRPGWRRGRGFTSTRVMKDLQQDTDLGPVFDTWNFASGIAHARPWALYTDFTPMATSEDGHGMWVNLSGDSNAMERSLLLAGSLTRRLEWHWYACHELLSTGAAGRRRRPDDDRNTAYLRGNF